MLPTADDLWSKGERRRTGSRLLQWAPARFAIGFVFLVPGAAAENFALATRVPWLRSVAACAAVLAYGATLLGFARWVEKRRPAEFGWRRAPLEWASGFLLGVVLLGATLGVLVALDSYRVEAGGSAAALPSGMRLFVPHALFEELLFRALLFKIAEESIGSAAALVLESALFGSLHLVNPGATAIGALAIALEAGILLTAAYMFTRRLWLVWGLHAGWNLTEGTLFGIRVSGTPPPAATVFSAAPTGAAWLTGGVFGIEASPVAVGLCLVAAAVLLGAAVRRGQWVRWTDQRRRIRELRAKQLQR
jgi:hypothetical protein